jgi:hypothetical protein
MGRTTLPAMPRLDFTDGSLKAALKEALVEVFDEQRDLLQEIIEDALQEMALAEALREIEAHERGMGQRAGFDPIKGEA